MRPEEKEDKRLAARRMMKEGENEKTRNTDLEVKIFSCLVILRGVVPFSRDIEPNQLTRYKHKQKAEVRVRPYAQKCLG